MNLYDVYLRGLDGWIFTFRSSVRQSVLNQAAWHIQQGWKVMICHAETLNIPDDISKDGKG